MLTLLGVPVGVSQAAAAPAIEQPLPRGDDSLIVAPQDILDVATSLRGWASKADGGFADIGSTPWLTVSTFTEWAGLRLTMP